MTATVETIYTDFHRQLHRFIAGRVSDPDDAEDILQEVYLKIHAHIASVREVDRLESWVYQITRNAIADHYRRARPQVELSEMLPAMAPEGGDAMQDLAQSVQEMLNCLPEKYRQALVLTELQGMTQVEMAGRLGLSVSGAKSRVQRAREKLREAYLDCCHFEFDRLGMVIDYQPRCEQCALDSSDCGDCAPVV